MPPPRFAVDAVACDVNTALLDSESLWAAVAGNAEQGRVWLQAERRLIYESANYWPFDDLLAASAREAGLDPARVVPELTRRWGELSSWPDVPAFLATLGARRLALVTNASERLAQAAAGIFARRPAVVVSAERAGAYKPDPRTYGLARAEIGLPRERILFIAGAPGDAAGAKTFGLPTIWVNRKGEAPPAVAPDVAVTDLGGIAALLA